MIENKKLVDELVGRLDSGFTSTQFHYTDDQGIECVLELYGITALEDEDQGTYECTDGQGRRCMLLDEEDEATLILL